MNLETQAISVDLEADTLVVVWADEHVSQFELVELRQSCSCAQCRELRVRGEAVWLLGAKKKIIGHAAR
jgi:DUF971 family protein